MTVFAHDLFLKKERQLLKLDSGQAKSGRKMDFGALLHYAKRKNDAATKDEVPISQISHLWVRFVNICGTVGRLGDLLPACAIDSLSARAYGSPHPLVPSLISSIGGSKNKLRFETKIR